MAEENKNIDESWKEEAQKQKQPQQGDANFVPPEPDFSFFITTLSLQASIALGTVPHPVTNKIETDITQAKFLIDTLGMLQEKTKGNLNAEEDQLLENFLYELRTMYVSKQKEGKK